MPLLAPRHRLIVPDLRGLGDSSRPLDGYDKKTVAGDLWQLLSGALGLTRWHLRRPRLGRTGGLRAGRGARRRDPDAGDRRRTLPGIGPDISQGGKRWHHAFHMTPDLPEALVQGRERAYLTWFYRTFSWQRECLRADDIDEYLRTYRQPDALRAGFAYYRNIPRDRPTTAARSRVGLSPAMPVLAVGGGRAEARGRGSEPEQSLKMIADDVTRRGHRRLRPLRARRTARRTGGAPARALRPRLTPPARIDPRGGPRRGLRPLPAQPPIRAQPRHERDVCVEDRVPGAPAVIGRRYELGGDLAERALGVGGVMAKQPAHDLLPRLEYSPRATRVPFARRRAARTDTGCRGRDGRRGDAPRLTGLPEPRARAWACATQLASIQACDAAG